jgi:hypothetical protein
MTLNMPAYKSTDKYALFSLFDKKKSLFMLNLKSV